MSLSKQLVDDFKSAIIAKDTVRKNTIQLLRADILNHSKGLQRDLTDAEIMEVVAKEIKQRQNALLDFQKANNDKLVEQTKQEIEILGKYLPPPMTRDELKDVVLAAKEDIGAESQRDMGRLIKAVKEKVGVRANGKDISELVKEILL